MAENFAAHVFLACFFIRHHTFGGGKYGDAQAVVYRLDILAFYVDSSAGLTNPLDFVNDVGLCRTVFEVYPQDPLLAVFEKLIVSDISLTFQYFCQLDF